MSEGLFWFEIPVNNFDRALAFYGQVFEKELAVIDMEIRKMGLLPAGQTVETGVGGSILSSPGFEPTSEGTIVYLEVGETMEPFLERVQAAGGQITMPKTEIGHGYLATFLDSEGNTVGLHAMS